MDRARDCHVCRPAEALPRVDRELDLDDEHQDGNVVVEQDDDDVRAVLGGLDLGQIDRGKACFSVGGEGDAQGLDQDLGGERGAVLEEIHQDLVGHGGHGGEGCIWAGGAQCDKDSFEMGAALLRRPDLR